MSVLIEASHIDKIVRDGETRLAVLSDVSLTIEQGEKVALMGPSGAGKSTLLYILGGLDNDHVGSVSFAGTTYAAISDAALSRLRNRELGFVFQSYNLVSELSAIENVLLPAAFGSDRVDRKAATAMLERVGLAARAHRRPGQLSGGECQRVAIARALVHNPRLILCDEPTGSLDKETGDTVLHLFDELAGEGTTVVIATHSERVAAMANRVLRLREGRLA
jgi:ABC-type lipoprotein export system ATPase subunit